MSEEASLQRLYRPPHALDLAQTLGGMGHSAHDPNARWQVGAFLWATRLPEGPATLRLAKCPDGVALEAWGAGAEAALGRAPRLLGAEDRPEAFAPTGKLLELHRRFAGLRLGATGAVYEAAVRAVLEQKVAGMEARRSFQQLCRNLGERAPGPAALSLVPAPAVLAAQPYWVLHPFGIEERRARTLRGVARAAAALEAPSLSIAQVRARLLAIPGVGPWTAAKVAAVALGDPDAVPVGDFHVKHAVTFAFTGEPRGTDERMLELLAPWAGQRGRVIRLIAAAGIEAPRFGPRQKLRDFRRW